MINNYDYDLEKLKDSLTEDKVLDMLIELGAEPEVQADDTIVCKTICHCGSAKKLYYYPNTKLCHCYTDCSGTFDFPDLVLRVKRREVGDNFQLPQAIDWVAQRIGFAPKESSDYKELDNIDDWKILTSYDRIKTIDSKTKAVEIKEYDSSILKHLPHCRIASWEAEGIQFKDMENFGICYNPKNVSVVIPHYDINNRLIGIRERHLIKETADKYGKYRPAYLNHQLYNHPLSFALYGLNRNKDNIKATGKAIVAEGEKSVIKYSSLFGDDNNIMVACCGSSLISYQVDLLKQCGAREIIVAFDKQFQDSGDAEFKKLTRNLEGIQRKYGNSINLSFMFDKWDCLGYKESPIDRDKKTFEFLFKNRVNLY